MTASRFFGQLFSFVFMPLFIPVFGMVWILYFGGGPETEMMHPVVKTYLLSVTAVFSSLLPLVTLIFMKVFGLTEKMELPKRRDRLMPIAISVVYAVFGYVFVLRVPNQNPFFYLLPLGSAAVLLVALVCTARFQISIHLLSIGALTATFVLATQFLGWNYLLPVLGSIVMAGCTGFARITLNAHKPYQVYTGYLTGFATQYVSMILLAWLLF